MRTRCVLSALNVALLASTMVALPTGSEAKSRQSREACTRITYENAARCCAPTGRRKIPPHLVNYCSYAYGWPPYHHHVDHRPWLGGPGPAFGPGRIGSPPAGGVGGPPVAFNPNPGTGPGGSIGGTPPGGTPGGPTITPPGGTPGGPTVTPPGGTPGGPPVAALNLNPAGNAVPGIGVGILAPNNGGPGPGPGFGATGNPGLGGGVAPGQAAR